MGGEGWARASGRSGGRPFAPQGGACGREVVVVDVAVVERIGRVGPPDHGDRTGSAERAARPHRDRVRRSARGAGRRALAGAAEDAAELVDVRSSRCPSCSMPTRRWTRLPVAWIELAAEGDNRLDGRADPRRRRRGRGRIDRERGLSDNVVGRSGTARATSGGPRRAQWFARAVHHPLGPPGLPRAADLQRLARRGRHARGRDLDPGRSSAPGTRSRRRSACRSTACAPCRRRSAGRSAGKWPLFDSLVAAAALRLRRPVRLVVSRADDFASTNPGQPFTTTRARRRGPGRPVPRPRGRDRRRHGAYEDGTGELLARRARRRPYAWPAFDVRAYGVRTNRFGVGAYRHRPDRRWRSRSRR